MHKLSVCGPSHRMVHDPRSLRRHPLLSHAKPHQRSLLHWDFGHTRVHKVPENFVAESGPFLIGDP